MATSKPLQVELPEALIQALKIHAAKTASSMRVIVETAIRDHLKQARRG